MPPTWCEYHNEEHEACFYMLAFHPDEEKEEAK